MNALTTANTGALPIEHGVLGYTLWLKEFGAVSEMITFVAKSSCSVILVEKTDRLYRNIKDWVTVADLDVEVHLVKEGTILSEHSRSSEKFMHGIRVLMAKNYIDNLSEEVRKGMREKAEQGHWPTVAHIGYINDTNVRRIDVDPVSGAFDGHEL